MKRHTIAGGGGLRLHVIEAGNAQGQPLVFIHGLSQGWYAWTRQIDSELAESFHLVALDLRGHGLSDKPRDAYADTRLWADDIHAVIQALNLDHPILCGWSYGPLVILDYLRHYGDNGIRGVNFVGAITKLGSEDAAAVLSGEFLALVPGLLSGDAEQSVSSLDSLLHLCFVRDFADEDRHRMLGCSVSAPPHVRQALFARSVDNDDLLPVLSKPFLITHGTDDAVVSPAVIDRQMARIPRARIHMLAGAGHACFWNDAPAYNRCLREFAATA